MDYVEKFFDGLQGYFNLNAATLSGAIDIVVVEQPDGTLKCTPFHVRFGKRQLINSREKTVTIYVNGEPTEMRMKLGSRGEAYFVAETKEAPPIGQMATSPIASPSLTRESSRTRIPDKRDPLSIPLTAYMEEANEEEPLISSSAPLPIVRINELTPRSRKKLEPYYDAETIRLSSSYVAPSEIPALQQAQPGVTWSWGDVPVIERSEQDMARNVLSDSEVNVYNAPEPELNNEARNKSWLSWLSFSRAQNPKSDSTADVEGLDDESPIVGNHRLPVIEGSSESSEFVVDTDIPTGVIEKDDDMFDMDLDESPEHLTVSEVNAERERTDSKEVYRQANSSDTTQVTAALKRMESLEHDDVAKNIHKHTDEKHKLNGIDWSKLEELDIQLSLCGRDIFQEDDEEKAVALFQEHALTLDKMAENPQALASPNLIAKIKNKYLPWSIASTAIVSVLVFKTPLDSKLIETLYEDFLIEVRKETEKKNVEQGGWSWFWPRRPSSTSDTPKPVIPKEVNKEATEQAVRSRSLSPVRGSDDESVSTDPETFYQKSVMPPPEMLKALNLVPGRNEIVFSVYSTLQGEQNVHASIYFYTAKDKLVISDIDGTITRSDVYGHVLPWLGKDWSHAGIAELYTNIKKNGYKIIYLTSRAIGQAEITKAFLEGVAQFKDDALANEIAKSENPEEALNDARRAALVHTLPDGPVFMSPARLLSAINREVILRKPEEFKIKCLSDIKDLWPNGINPFYAGFGNRITDQRSYLKVGIPDGRIFIVNPKSEITINNLNGSNWTYKNINQLLKSVFPTLSTTQRSELEALEYSDTSYWGATSNVYDSDDLEDFV